MPWPKGKSRRRSNAARKGWATRTRRRGYRKIASGGIGLLPRAGKVQSGMQIGSGLADIAKSRKYTKTRKRRR